MHCALRVEALEGFGFVEFWLDESGARLVDEWPGIGGDLAPVMAWAKSCSIESGLPPLPPGWRLVLADEGAESFADFWELEADPLFAGMVGHA